MLLEKQLCFLYMKSLNVCCEKGLLGKAECLITFVLNFEITKATISILVYKYLSQLTLEWEGLDYNELKFFLRGDNKDEILWKQHYNSESFILFEKIKNGFYFAGLKRLTDRQVSFFQETTSAASVSGKFNVNEGIFTLLLKRGLCTWLSTVLNMVQCFGFAWTSAESWTEPKVHIFWPALCWSLWVPPRSDNHCLN